MDVMSALGGWELEALAKEALEQVGITNTNMPVAKMSGGQRRKVTVAAALLGAPDVLILDEPTNHMDVQVPRRSCSRDLSGGSCYSAMLVVEPTTC